MIEQLRKDGISYITATHDVQNPRSGEVMKKLGMSYQYSYEEKWQPKDLLAFTFRMYQLNLDEQEDRFTKNTGIIPGFILWRKFNMITVYFQERALYAEHF